MNLRLWRPGVWWLAASLAAAAAPALAQETNRTVRVLLVTGIDYPGHHWRETTPVLKGLLEHDPRLDVRVVEDPGFLDSAELTNYAVVLLHFMNWECSAPGRAARENLRRFVEGGKGLMLVHFACGAWQDWPEFRRLAGRVWDPHLRPHDPRGPFQVEIADPQHPITHGLEPFTTDDELYTCLAGESPIQVLAVARSKGDGKPYPMAFVHPYGQGRVFVTVLGHDTKALTLTGVPNLLRRGCAWAAGVPVTP